MYECFSCCYITVLINRIEEVRVKRRFRFAGVVGREREESNVFRCRPILDNLVDNPVAKQIHAKFAVCYILLGLLPVGGVNINLKEALLV
ncbi:hypothetical protein D3C78_1339730 [compost metagenome]